MQLSLTPPPPDLNTVLCQTNTNAGYVHTLYQSFCLHEIRKWCQIKTDHFLVVIDFKVSLINRLYCNLRDWRRKGFSDNFYLALQCFFNLKKYCPVHYFFPIFFFKNNFMCNEIPTQSIFSLKLSLPQGTTHNWLTCVAWKFRPFSSSEPLGLICNRPVTTNQ